MPFPTEPPESSFRPTLVRRILAAFGAFLLIVVALICARMGIADRMAAEAIGRYTELLSRAEKTGELVTARDATAVGESLIRAQRFETANPTTAEQLGILYSLNVRTGEVSDAGVSIGNQRIKSLEQYSMAVVLRPTSPYSWAGLAWTKYHLGQVDAEFYRAMHYAIRLGPWEPEVQFVVVDLGFALWDEMPAELRPQIIAMAQNSQRRYATQIIAIAQKRGRLAEVCKFEKLATRPECKAIAG